VPGKYKSFEAPVIIYIFYVNEKAGGLGILPLNGGVREPLTLWRNNEEKM